MRIPVLYGPVEKLSESAVTCLLEPLLNVAKPSKVSDFEKRCPSHVDDIADICLNLAESRVQVCKYPNSVNQSICNRI